MDEQAEMRAAQIWRQSQKLIDTACPIIHEIDQKYGQKMREAWEQVKRQ